MQAGEDSIPSWVTQAQGNMLSVGRRFPVAVQREQPPNVVIAEFDGDIRVAGTGRKYDNHYINVFTFRADGKLVHVKEFFNPLVLIDGGAFDNGAPRTGRP